MTGKYYSELIPRLSARAKTGTLSWIPLNNLALRQHLNEAFDGEYGNGENFLGDPVFEGTFGWEATGKTLDELAGSVLSLSLVKALDQANDENRLPKNIRPYVHQLKSWQILGQKDNKSIIVTSGTGSGKTECFLIPVLNDLIRTKVENESVSSGVRAIMLYPLNALINSQRERLQSWTKPFGGKVRFGLYNGMTPEKLPIGEKAKYRNEVLDRLEMRESPPDIMVTNPTMLEYILVRNEDASIIDKSQKTLQWIILDEAHTYIGSQAAEMSLLIRRVLDAFGKRPEEIKFVATSATIGSKEGEASLRTFMARLIGVPEHQVVVITGKRSIPILNHEPVTDGRSIQELQKHINEPNLLYDLLEKNRMARAIRTKIIKSDPGVASLRELRELLRQVSGTTFSAGEALEWIDLLTSAIKHEGNTKTPFLPVRAHLFHKVLSGLWACCNKGCSEIEHSMLKDKGWPFGKVYFEPRKSCGCGAPVYELNSCSDCGEVFLIASMNDDQKLVEFSHNQELDDFQIEVEEEQAEQGVEEDEENHSGNLHKFLIAGRHHNDLTHAYLVEHDTRRILPEDEGLPCTEVNLVQSISNTGPDLCPNCSSTDPNYKVVHRSFRVGAPFLLSGLIPTALDFAKPSSKKARAPFLGKRLLSFSDSRQGTARLAAKIQQDSERNFIRGLIYHVLLEETNSGSLPAHMTKAIEGIRNSSMGDDEKQRIINSLIPDQPKSVSFYQLRAILKSQAGGFDFIKDLYARYNPRYFGRDEGKNRLAEILILRELLRRPSRQNNLETLGLVKFDYPSLNQVKEAPAIWTRKDLSLDQWKNYLSYILTFFVRANGAVDIEDFNTKKAWMGLPYFQTFLVEPDRQDIGRYQKRWPNTKTGRHRSRVVHHTARILHLDLEKKDDMDMIDEVLRDSFGALQKSGIFTLQEQGYRLSLDKIAFGLVEQAFYCPQTRRFISVLPTNVSPYTPIKAIRPVTCEKVEIPLYPESFGATTDVEERRNKAKAWVKTNSNVAKLRFEGYWTEFHDNVIEMTPYFRTAEHSAQQNSSLLKSYEKQFRDGEINLLSCSTTMEMGIDIGGIQMVSMTNLPPHTANYLQRAGRAGRRGETRSTAVTLCKSNPHDLLAYENGKWAFTTKLAAPYLSLDRLSIIQRHINAVLLTKFLRRFYKDAQAHSLTTGWFFGSEDPPVNKFKNWCSLLSRKGEQDEVKRSLFQLLYHTAYANSNVSAFLKYSIAKIEEIADEWKAESERIEKSWNAIEDLPERDPTRKAINFQKSRLENEYLLRELASSGFLPGYGFPSNIVAFDSLNIHEDYGDQSNGREDNNFRRRELPSRDAISALREYAPGADVVMDGRVYKPSGIILNWHRPASQTEASEPLAIKFSWRCRKCGSSGQSISYSTTTQCAECGSEDMERMKYLQPSGYAVDFYNEPHNDVSKQDFIPINPPIVSSKGSWSPFANPNLGRFRISPDTQILYYSSGKNDNGYAVCLSCGRAEAMHEHDILPPIFSDPRGHQPVRPRKKDTVCDGSENAWSIKKNLNLGHSVISTVLEIQLRSVEGSWLKSSTIATTIAVALRSEIAELLGVNVEELDCLTQEKNEDGGKRRSIFIFDKNNAGYVDGIADHMALLLRKTRARLAECDCDAYCPKCILEYDQRFLKDRLNRIKGLSFMTQDWIDSLSTPDELNFFGTDSKVEPNSIGLSLMNAARFTNQGIIRLYVEHDLESDFSNPEFKALLYELSQRGKSLQLILGISSGATLSEEQKADLLSYRFFENVEIYSTNEITRTPRLNGKILASFQGADRSFSWAVAEQETAKLDQWVGARICVRGVGLFDKDINQPIDLESRLKDQEKNAIEVKVRRELDGPIKNFGNRFWKFMINNGKSILEDLKTSPIARITYTDRYINTPLSAKLISELVLSLIKLSQGENTPDVKIQAARFMNSRYQGKVYNQFDSDQIRDAVLKELLHLKGVAAVISSKDRRDIAHARYFQIELQNGKVINCRLDQGVGYWEVEKSYSRSDDTYFDFGDVSGQVQQLAKANFSLVAKNFPSPITISST